MPKDLLAQWEAAQDMSKQGQPVEDTPAENTTTAEPLGAVDSFVDGAKGIVNGATDAIQSTLDLSADVANVAVDGINAVAGTDIQHGSAPQLPRMDDSETIGGQFSEGITQFAVGFLGGQRVLKGVAEGVGAVRKSMAAGALADFTAFDEHEARLSNLVEEHAPSLSNPLTRYLAADDNDSWAEGRFKNALEGVALGGAVETAFKLFKGVKGVRKARDAGDNAAAQEQAAKLGEGDLSGAASARLHDR